VEAETGESCDAITIYRPEVGRSDKTQEEIQASVDGFLQGHQSGENPQAAFFILEEAMTWIALDRHEDTCPRLQTPVYTCDCRADLPCDCHVEMARRALHQIKDLD
jgi:hypothetical protein